MRTCTEAEWGCVQDTKAPTKCTEFKLKLVSLETSLIYLHLHNFFFYFILSLHFKKCFSCQFSSLEVCTTKKHLILYKEENEKTIYTDYYQKQKSQNFKKLALLSTFLKESLQSLHVKVSERGENYLGGGREILYLFVLSISFYT